jgi:hypothetical protein
LTAYLDKAQDNRVKTAAIGGLLTVLSQREKSVRADFASVFFEFSHADMTRKVKRILGRRE